MELARGLHRLGSRYINFYALLEGGRVTLVDAGIKGYADQVERFLGAYGKTARDVAAIVLTHGHPDHIGLAEELRISSGAPVYVHEADAALVKGELGKPKPPLPKPSRFMLAYAFHGLRNGITKIPEIGEATTYADGDTLDVPGGLRAIHLPGHTPGNSALVCESRGVLFAGDSIATLDMTGGPDGPCMLPSAFHSDFDQAVSSLDRLEGLELETTVVGHGEPWSGSVADALERARSRAVSG